MVILPGCFWSCAEAVHYGGESVVEQSCCCPGLMGTREREEREREEGRQGPNVFFISFLNY